MGFPILLWLTVVERVVSLYQRLRRRKKADTKENSDKEAKDGN